MKKLMDLTREELELLSLKLQVLEKKATLEFAKAVEANSSNGTADDHDNELYTEGYLDAARAVINLCGLEKP